MKIIVQSCGSNSSTTKPAYSIRQLKEWKETKSIVLELKNNIETRLAEEYLPLMLRNDLKNLIEGGQIDKDYFISKAKKFYTHIIEYLEKYSEQYKNFESFSWVTLKQPISWQMIEKSIIYYLNNVDNKLDDNNLFTEVINVESFINSNVPMWNESKVETDQR